MHLLADGNNRVRSSALKMLTASLQRLQRLPRSDANVFGEYILPAISIVSMGQHQYCSFCVSTYFLI